MDCFAASVAGGLAVKQLKLRHAFRVAFFFGLFQALMPVVGFFAGIGFRGLISSYDHWIAFALLSAIGAKMIYESFTLGEGKESSIDLQKLAVVLLLSITTSIDALMVGVSLAFIKVPIVMPSVVIGIVAFLMSLAGVQIGKHCGHFFEGKVEFIGGLLLIGIGFKILLEHIWGL